MKFARNLLTMKENKAFGSITGLIKTCLKGSAKRFWILDSLRVGVGPVLFACKLTGLHSLTKHVNYYKAQSPNLLKL
jgi:hypothetical protein